MNQDTVAKIKKIVNDEYKDYPELKEYEDRLYKMYLSEYEHITSNKRYFNLKNPTEEELLDLTFTHVNKIWKDLFEGVQS